MVAFLHDLLSDDAANLRRRIIGVYVILVAGNLAAWGFALVAFAGQPVQIRSLAGGRVVDLIGNNEDDIRPLFCRTKGARAA